MSRYFDNAISIFDHLTEKWSHLIGYALASRLLLRLQPCLSLTFYNHSLCSSTRKFLRQLLPVLLPAACSTGWAG